MNSPPSPAFRNPIGGASVIEEIDSLRPDVIIRRHVLQPGEALPRHRDRCRRFTVVLRGEALLLEFADTGETVRIDVVPGQADWDEPTERLHRAVNVGGGVYEEVIIFFVDEPGIEPQPEG